SVQPAIVAIDVIEDARMYHRVIQRRVERLSLSICPARDLDLAQLLVPSRFCIGANLVKIPAGHLGSEILSRSFDGDGRNADFYKNLICCIRDLEAKIVLSTSL